MSMFAALNTARSSLSTISVQSSVAARNVARASEPGATRKNVEVVTDFAGGVRVAGIERAADDALFKTMLGATSAAAARDEVATGLSRLETTVDDPDLSASPAALVTKLETALQGYATNPDSTAAGQSAVNVASDLARSLNEATAAVSQLRQQADDDLSASVERVNGLLKRLEDVDGEVVRTGFAGGDATDAADARDQILTSLAEEIGIKTLQRSDGGLTVTTETGIMLYDRTARSVSLAKSPLGPGLAGNPVQVDGVPVTGSSAAPAALKTGRMAGLAELRDTLAPTYQAQLDEIARGLIEATAETPADPASTSPAKTGLFTHAGAPGIPASAVTTPGLAGSIAVAAAVDPARGGDVRKLRDGGISGDAAYVSNTSGATGYTARLQELSGRLNSPRAFDAAAGAGSRSSVSGYAAASVSWLERERSEAADEANYRDTLLQRASSNYSSATGVNLDEEIANMMELERAYQASSKVIAVVDQMFQSLLDAVR